MDHRRGQEPLDTRDARGIFSGDLSEVALVDLVQTLELGRRTGVVRLTGPAGRAATLWLRDGRPVDCELGAAQGEAAFHRLLRWTGGEFAVEFEPVTRPARIAASTQALVLEGLRRAEAWRAAAARLPDLGAPVEIDYRLLSDRLAEIPDDVNALLRTVDGRRTLGQVIEEAGLDELAAAAMVERLFAEQILRLAPPRAAPTSAPVRAATPDPERVTWFAGPSEREPAPAPPAARPPPAPAPAPAAAAPARPRAAAPVPAPQPEGRPGEPRPPRIVRFPPREKAPVPTPRPGDPGMPPPAAPQAASRRAPARPAAVRPAPQSGGRALRVALVLAVVALAAVAVAWGRWRGGGGRAAAAGAYEAEVAEARRLHQAGRLDEAIAGYRRALAGHDTSDGEAELGRMLTQAAQPAAAIAALQRAVELDAANAGAYMALGEAFLGEQRLGEARGAFERYLALEPQGGRADEVRAALERIPSPR